MKVGDLIELVSMPNDPCPVATGTQGVITRETDLSFMNDGQPSMQYDVKWEDGRTLSAVVPPDVLRVVLTREDLQS